jgi:hypothetical protein
MSIIRRFLTGFLEDDSNPAVGPGDIYGRQDGTTWIVTSSGLHRQLGLATPGGGGGVDVSRATVSYTDIIFPTGGTTTTLALETLNLGDVLMGVGIVVTEDFDDSGTNSASVMDGTQQIVLAPAISLGSAQVDVAGFQQLNHGSVTFGKAYLLNGDGVNLLIAASGWVGDGTQGSLDVYFWVARAANITPTP